MSAAATESCCGCLSKSEMLTDGGLSFRSKASTIVSPKGSPSFRATPTPISIDYPTDAFDYVILSQTLQATRQSARRAGTSSADRAPRYRFGAEFRPLESSGAARPSRPDASDQRPSSFLVRHAEHSFLHHCRFHRAGAQHRRNDRQEHGARCSWTAAQSNLAEMGVEPARRTGNFSAASRTVSSSLLLGAIRHVRRRAFPLAPSYP